MAHKTVDNNSEFCLV